MTEDAYVHPHIWIKDEVDFCEYSGIRYTRYHADNDKLRIGYMGAYQIWEKCGYWVALLIFIVYYCGCVMCKSVVELDFTMNAESIDLSRYNPNTLVDIVFGDKTFLCLLPDDALPYVPLETTLNLDDPVNFVDEDPHGLWWSIVGYIGYPLFNLWDYMRQFWITDRPTSVHSIKTGHPVNVQPNYGLEKLSIMHPKMLRYLILSRMAFIFHKCYIFKRINDVHWYYELCVGHRVSRLAVNENNTIVDNTNLGLFDSMEEKLYANGSVTQLYVNGTGNVKTQVYYRCGDMKSQVTGVSLTGNIFKIFFASSSFCDFREHNPSAPSYSSLLRNLEGWCKNFTDKSYTYEFCYPDSLIQFHLESDGSIKEQMFLLGTLYNSGAQDLYSLQRPSPDFPVLRGPNEEADDVSVGFFDDNELMTIIDLHNNQSTLPNGNMANNKSSGILKNRIHFRNLPLEIIDIPIELFPDELPLARKALSLNIFNGTICRLTGVPRSSRVIFFCRNDFISNPVTDFVNVVESRTCHYDVVIGTPLICSHPQLMPPFFPDFEMTKCFKYKREIDTLNKGKSNEFRNNQQWKNDLSEEYNISSNGLLEGLNVFDILEKKYYLLEMVPHKYYLDFNVIEELQNFSWGNYRRLRISENYPLFKIGNVVKHKWWMYRGVVVGWDMQCNAPNSWIRRVYREYSFDHFLTPHYLILIDHSFFEKYDIKMDYLYSYVPQIGISLDTSGNYIISNPYFNDYFVQFNSSLNQWIAKYGVMNSGYLDDYSGYLFGVQTNFTKNY